jgi:hypothetical protein
MHDLAQLTIEQLAELRDAVTARLADRVSARQKELQAEQDRIGGLVEGKAKPRRPVKYRSGVERMVRRRVSTCLCESTHCRRRDARTAQGLNLPAMRRVVSPWKSSKASSKTDAARISPRPRRTLRSLA